MKIKTIKTEKIRPFTLNVFEILSKYLYAPKEKSVVAVTSKIVALCEGRVIKTVVDKDKIIKSEAEYYLPRKANGLNVMLTIKNNILIPTSGIDESNGDGYYILWPKNPQTAANNIRKYLIKRFHLKKVGVIITDSRTSPLRRGTSGIAIAYSGFTALKNYIGEPDIFGRKLIMTKVNIIDSLAAAAVLMMGEGKEQTPLAVIENLDFVNFKNLNPTKKELAELHIEINDDIYYPLLKNTKWKKGGQK